MALFLIVLTLVLPIGASAPAHDSSMPFAGERGPALAFASTTRAHASSAVTVPIQVTNAQSVPSPAPFQLKLVVDSLTYASYEATNLSNVEFTYTNGTVVPSWLESGALNNATSSVYWLNLINGVPAGSTVTLEMVFQPLGTLTFNGYRVGEAPTLSLPVGIYDNGRDVFNEYQNFLGNSSSLSTIGWASSGNGCCTTYVGISNDELSVSSVNVGTAYAVSPITIGPTSVVDGRIAYVQEVAGGYQLAIASSSSSSSYVGQGDSVGYLDGSSPCNTFGVGSPLQVLSPSLAPVASASAGAYTWSILSVDGPTVYVNYSSVTTSVAPVLSSGYLAMFTSSPNYCGSTVAYSWVRVRAEPPNGVMPIATLGAPGAGVLSAVFTGAPASGTAPLAVRFQATAQGGSPPYTYDWRFGDGTSCTGCAGSGANHTYGGVGTFQVSLWVLDSSGSNASGGSFTVTTTSGGAAGAPVITAFSIAPGSVPAGGTVTLSVTASGGSPPFSYAYVGLPPGCTSSNRPSLTCAPSSRGDFTVRAYVNDSTGASASATAALQVVGGSPTPSYPTGTSSSSQFLGLPGLEGLLVVGGVVALLLVSLALIARTAPEDEAPPATRSEGSS